MNRPRAETQQAKVPVSGSSGIAPVNRQRSVARPKQSDLILYSGSNTDCKSSEPLKTPCYVMLCCLIWSVASVYLLSMTHVPGV